MKSIILTLIIQLSIVFIVQSGWVVYTCSQCISLSCQSKKCYNLSGSGYPAQAKDSNFQVCSQQDCSNQAPYGKFATQCQYDTNQTACLSGCCVRQRHASLNNMCTSQFPQGERFCSTDLDMKYIIGIIFGSLGAVCIIAVIVTCIWKKCFECCFTNKDQLLYNQQRRRKYVKEGSNATKSQKNQNENASSVSQKTVSSKSKATEINFKGDNKQIKNNKEKPNNNEIIVSSTRLKQADLE